MLQNTFSVMILGFCCWVGFNDSASSYWRSLCWVLFLSDCVYSCWTFLCLYLRSVWSHLWTWRPLPPPSHVHRVFNLTSVKQLDTWFIKNHLSQSFTFFAFSYHSFTFSVLLLLALASLLMLYFQVFFVALQKLVWTKSYKKFFPILFWDWCDTQEQNVFDY